MAVTIAANSVLGYRQLEPNHLSAPRNGHVYAQLPAASSITVLEQGTFVKYDYENGEVNFTGDGPWMLVYNEEKLYDRLHQMHRDFALKAEDMYGGVMTPRVFLLEPGDIFTTNNLADGTYTLGGYLKVGTTGVLEAGTAATDGFKIVKETTLPDGQAAVKVQVIA